MVDKLHDYQGPIGQLHTIRDNVRSNFSEWKEKHSDFDKKLVDTVLRRRTTTREEEDGETFDFSHIHRKKTRWELLRLCAVVAGIEFSYSAITAFSSPILLEMGINPNFMSMVFSLSPMLGFFLSPVCGSLSDRCTSIFGRRRIFIVVFSLIEIIGLFLIPLGYDYVGGSNSLQSTKTNLTEDGQVSNSSDWRISENQERNSPPSWIITVTILGIVISDHFADNLQNPSRAYLLDVCDEADHTRGLSTFTILAGSGGFIGYGLGSINWDNSVLGEFFGGHVKTVFRLTTFLFIACVILTITSFKEVPLNLLHKIEKQSKEVSENSVA